MRVRADGDADAARFRLPQQAAVRVEIAPLLFIGMVAIEKARVELDRQALAFGDIEHLVFVAFERRVVGPVAEDRRDVEVADDVAGQPLEGVEQHAHVELPGLFGADLVVEPGKFGIIERPIPVGAVDGVLDRDEMDRADEAVGPHRIDDVLGVGPCARIVVDLGADREAHAAAQAFRDDLGVHDVDVGGLGGAVQIAGLGQFEGAPDEVDRGRIFERQRIHVVGDHQKTRISAPAGVEKPQEQHARRQGQGTFLGVGLVFALGVAVDIRDGVHARVALGMHETCVLSLCGPGRPFRGRTEGKKKPADDQPADKGLRFRRLPGLGPSTSNHRETRLRTLASNDDHLLLSACYPSLHLSSEGAADVM